MSRRNSFLFTLPAAVLYIVFVAFAIVYGFYFSFTNADGISQAYKFIGLSNYRNVLSDPRFWNSICITLIFTVLSAVLINMGALVIAFILEIQISKRIQSMVRVLIFLPTVMMPVIVGFIWYYYYKFAIPSVFEVLGLTELSKIEFIGTDKSLYSTIIVSVWLQTGTSMMIYIAALTSIPKEIHESAKMDGASALKVIRHISIPLLAAAFSINIVLSIINGFKQFDQIWVMTKGGPGNSTEVLSLLIYNKAYSANDMGFATVTGFIMFLIVMFISVYIIRIFKKKEVAA